MASAKSAIPVSLDVRDALDPVGALRRALYRSAKQDGKRRFHSLYDKCFRMDVLWQAWVGVRANGGAPGVDGVSLVRLDGGRRHAPAPLWLAQRWNASGSITTERERISAWPSPQSSVQITG